MKLEERKPEAVDKRLPYEAPRVTEDVPLETASLACAGSKSAPPLGCGTPFVS